MICELGSSACARMGGLGQAQYDLLVPFVNLAQSAFLELPRTRPKPQSEHEAGTEQATRTNVSGQCEVFAKCERTIEPPQNVETGAPRADANDGGRDGQNIATMLKYKYKSFLEE